MGTPAEDYFLAQVRLSRGPSDVDACGYFIPHLGKKRGLAVFTSAATAKALFVALTPDYLYVVKTRVPATRAPLLENEGQFEVDCSELKVEFSADRFELRFGEESIPLALDFENKAFPRQEELVAALSARFGNGATLDALRSESKRRKLGNIVYFIALAVVGVAVALLTR